MLKIGGVTRIQASASYKKGHHDSLTSPEATEGELLTPGGSDLEEDAHLFSCTGEGNGNPLQCSCLENTRDRGAWWAAIYGVAQSRTRLKRLSSSSSPPVENAEDYCAGWDFDVNSEPLWNLLTLSRKPTETQIQHLWPRKLDQMPKPLGFPIQSMDKSLQRPSIYKRRGGTDL